MTACAIVRKLRRLVVGTLCSCEIGLMAAEAIGAQSFELTILVAGYTICSQMCAGQRERSCRMVERRRLPSNHSVTACAIVRKLSCLVVRALCAAEVSLVTRKTIGRQHLILSALVTRRTWDAHVRPLKRECCLAVVEGGE